MQPDAPVGDTDVPLEELGQKIRGSSMEPNRPRTAGQDFRVLKLPSLEVVVAHVGAAVGPGDAEVQEQLGDGLGGHGAAARDAIVMVTCRRGPVSPFGTGPTCSEAAASHRQPNRQGVARARSLGSCASHSAHGPERLDAAQMSNSGISSPWRGARAGCADPRWFYEFSLESQPTVR